MAEKDSGIIVLTGGTAGIGAALAERLIASGHRLVVVARRAGALPPHPARETMACDLADAAAVRRVAAEIAGRHPRIAMLINNAAVQYAVPLTDPAFDPDAMARELSLNLLAPALLAHGLLPALMVHPGGATILNIGSGLAFHPKRNTALYCASKAGLHSFSQSLRYQLEGSPVRVAEAILPLVETGMTAGRGRGKISPGAAADAILAGLAGGRAEILVGKARRLPWMDRLAPGLARRIMKQG